MNLLKSLGQTQNQDATKTKKTIERIPKNIGWLESKLNSEEIDYIWRCIDNKKEKLNNTLAGHLSGSYRLQDKSNWCWSHILIPLINEYEEKFGNFGERLPLSRYHSYYLHNWWVNYQREGEFNPIHDHTGVYSFVIWMKIPYKDKEQQNLQIAKDSNNPSNGTFVIYYLDTLGKIRTYDYHLNPEDEGRMLFFPSPMNHAVHPYFGCDEERISVSGNIRLNTSKGT